MGQQHRGVSDLQLRIAQSMREDAEKFRQSQIEQHERWEKKFNADRQLLIEGAAERIVALCSDPSTPVDEAFGQKVQDMMPALVELADFSNMEPPREPRWDAHGNRIR